MKSKDSMSHEIKRDYGDFLIKAILEHNPNLTRKQVMRICNHTYSRIRTGDDIYEKTKAQFKNK